MGTSASSSVVVYAPNGGALPGVRNARAADPTFTWQSPNKILQPLLISVDAGASAGQPYPCGNVGYNWDFGGASTTPGSDYLREGVVQDYEYALPGIYTVTLIVTNPAGSSAPYTQTIVLGTTTCNQPTATFTVSPAAIIKNGNITNWQAANNGGNGATMFTFDGSSSAFMSDRRATRPGNGTSVTARRTCRHLRRRRRRRTATRTPTQATPSTSRLPSRMTRATTPRRSTSR